MTRDGGTGLGRTGQGGTGQGRSGEGRGRPGSPVELARQGRRLLWVAVVLAALAVVGAIVEGLLSGLTFAVLIGWGSRWVIAVVVVGVAVVAGSALRGAGRARRRGERLASDGVGLVPPRPPAPPRRPPGSGTSTRASRDRPDEADDD